MSRTDEDGIVVPVVINGQTVNALIDTGSTGANPITLSKNLADKLRLQSRSASTANAYGGPIKLAVVTVASFQIGGLFLANQSADVAPSSGSSGDDVDVIIGEQLLLGMLMQVDWDKHRVRFLLTGDMPDAAGDVPTHIDQRTKFLIVPTDVCGVERSFALDTGLEDDAHLNIADVPLDECTSVLRSDLSATGLGGKHIKEIISLSSLRLGSREFPEIVAGLEGQGDPLPRRGIAGSVGYGILRRSNFVLDAGADRLRFYGSYRYGRKVERPTLGVQFTSTPEVLTITHLMSNSPASRTTLEVGDRICKVNSKTIRYWDGAFPMRPPAGTTTTLELCDGRKVQMVSQDFLAVGRPAAPPPPIPEPAGIGQATEGLALCQGTASQAAIDGCSAVIRSARILGYYRTNARLQRAQLYDRLGRPSDAIADIDALIGENGKTAPLLSLRAQSDTKLGKYQDASSELDAALTADPNFIPAYLFRALLEYKTGQFDKGIEAASKALALAPENYRARDILARGYLYLGKLDQAFSAVTQAIEQEKNYPDTYATRGQIYEKEGKVDLARTDFQQALKLDPSNADAGDGMRRLSSGSKTGRR